MTTSRRRQSSISEHSPRHSRVRRKAVIIGVIAVALTLSWLVNPVVAGVLTIIASVVLAAVLAPGPIEIDPHSTGRDYRNDVGW